MSYDLEPVKKGVRPESINQAVWPPIWRWLCAQHNKSYVQLLTRKFVKSGSLNNNLFVAEEIALRMAVILEKRKPPARIASLLTEPSGNLCGARGTRRERLIYFFRTSGGFRIR